MKFLRPINAASIKNYAPSANFNNPEWGDIIIAKYED
jgi:hypothetical protein